MYAKKNYAWNESFLVFWGRMALDSHFSLQCLGVDGSRVTLLFTVFRQNILELYDYFDVVISW